MATLRDVAELAGVSIRTVSYAVTDPDRVGAETLSKVRAAIAELRYTPNEVARGLRSGRSGLVGLIVPNVEAPYFAEIARELIAELSTHGMTLVIDQTDGDLARERELLSTSRAAAFDGLIISPLGLTADDIAQRPTDRPVVLLGERIVGSTGDHVAVSNVQAAYDATAFLVSRGYRSIAAIGRQDRPRSHTTALRLAGFERALAEAGLEPVAPGLTVDDFTRPDGLRAMELLLDGPEPPDAVFCFNDLLALGALRAAFVRGVAVPDDLGILGFDDIEDGRFCTPSLSTVRPDKKQLAALTVKLLLERLDGADGPWESKLVAHTLEARESTR